MADGLAKWHRKMGVATFLGVAQGPLGDALTHASQVLQHKLLDTLNTVGVLVSCTLHRLQSLICICHCLSKHGKHY